MRHRRRGSAYLAVLGSAVIVAVISLSSLMVTRIHHHTAQSAAGAGLARFYARSAVEIAIGGSAVYDNWRTSLGLVSGQLFGIIFDGGMCYFTLVDEVDDDLANDPDHPVRITGSGDVDDAVFAYSVLAVPPPLNCLQAAVHACGVFTVQENSVLTVDGAPAFCSYDAGFGFGTFYNDSGATLNGDVEAKLVANLGTITGSVTENAPPKELPTSATINYYRSLATPISWAAIPSGVLANQIVDTTGNPDGLYHIDTQGNDLTIENCRIEGTLVVDVVSPQKVIISKGIYWEPHRSDFPALIVNGDCDIGIEYPLSEPDTGVNFNPVGFPYEGDEDTDANDVYPGVIKGLVHITGVSTELRLSTQIGGAVIAHGQITVWDSVSVTYNPNLALNPPKRYRATRLNVVPGTWRRELAP